MTAAVSSNSAPDSASVRAAIVAEARRWIGTPYHHRAALFGVGCDCLGLVRGVWANCFGLTLSDLPAYTGDWGDVTGVEGLIEGLGKYLFPVPPDQTAPGDVLVFRMRRGRVAKHCGIKTGPTGFVHAWEAGPVAEVAQSDWWGDRIVAAFAARQTQGAC